MEYGRKWKEELEEKGKHLTLRFGRVHVATDEEIIAGVTWSDKDLGDKEPEDFRANVVVIGKIEPPLSDNEFEYLGLGPKNRVNGKITLEELMISCEEAKVKMLWELRNNIVDEDEENKGEEAIDEEMKKRIQEEEEERRQVYDMVNKILDLS